MRAWTITIVLCSGWLASTASGQTTRPFDTGRGTPSRAASYGVGMTRPTVSPYVNLELYGSNAPTYQTLVRPMIEERERLDRQAGTLDQMNRRLSGGPQGEPGGRPRQSGVRFLHYSHYFGTVR